MHAVNITVINSADDSDEDQEGSGSSSNLRNHLESVINQSPVFVSIVVHKEVHAKDQVIRGVYRGESTVN